MRYLRNIAWIRRVRHRVGTINVVGGVMQILPIDLVALVSVILGISIVLVPVIGLTARFALKPAVEAFAKLFEARGEEQALNILERRIELQEQEIAMLHQTVQHLSEAHDFDRRLITPSVTGDETATEE